MKLSELISELDVLYIKGSINKSIDGIAYNSQLSGKDFIFVAIEGLKLDGHMYINDAVSRGANTIIYSRDVNFNPDVTYIRVSDTRLALSKLASRFYRNPSTKMILIGVTGTNGKTTTSYYIKSILDKSFNNSGLIGSLGIYKKNLVEQSTHTTPESLELQKSLAHMTISGIKTCVMEVSSHAIKLHRINDCDFDIGIFTNLTHEHLDFHTNMEDYYYEKRKLFLMTRGYNIVNIDDKYGKRLIKDIGQAKPSVISYGINQKADIYAENIRLYNMSSKFLLHAPTWKTEITIKIPGMYNIYNALASAACGYALGINSDNIKDALESVNNIPGRFEFVPNNMNLNIIIDYAHTPDGFLQLLETVSRFAKGRIILVFGCVGERDQSKRSIMGRIAGSYCDLCVLTTDNCRSENPKDIIDNIKEGFNFYTSYIEIIDRSEAIRYAILNSNKGDTILITGKGHEKRQIIGDNIYYFDEKEIIRKALIELRCKQFMKKGKDSLHMSNHQYY